MVDRHPDRETEKEADRVYRVRKQQPDHDAEAAASQIGMRFMKALATGRPMSFQTIKDMALDELKEFHVKQVRAQKG